MSVIFSNYIVFPWALRVVEFAKDEYGNFPQKYLFQKFRLALRKRQQQLIAISSCASDITLAECHIRVNQLKKQVVGRKPKFH